MPTLAQRVAAVFVALLSAAVPISAQAPPAAAPLQPIPILWLEPVGEGQARGDDLRLFRPIPAEDPRLKNADKLIENEAAAFTRSLVAWAWRTFPPPADWTPPRLAIAFAQGGNNAETGFRLQVGEKIEEHPDVPMLILQLDTGSLSNTLAHEGGHLLQTIASRGARPQPWWTAILHSTFAVTDPLTALAEGYAIHFETLWAHFGKTPDMRAYYNRLSPQFDLQGRRADYYAPIADLMTFSQTWARYQAVRDEWPSFAGHVYPGDYMRSQYDAARDRSSLKSANAMAASEGVVASAIFWTVAAIAERGGATPGEGLDQKGLLEAEQAVLRGLATMKAGGPGGAASASDPGGAAGPSFRPDILDLVAAIGAPGSAERQLAISRFVGVTRGVTAAPGIAAKWGALHRAALGLDFEATKPIFTELDTQRAAILQAALKDPTTLRRMVGPVLPVRAPTVRLELKMLGQAFELDFDLNAAGEAEWLAAGADRAAIDAILRERDTQPFASIRDFEKRTGKTLKSLGLVPVDRE